MPHILILALVGAGLWVGYRLLRDETRRVNEKLRHAEAELKRRDETAIPSLEPDPETGVYGPQDGDRDD